MPQHKASLHDPRRPPTAPLPALQASAESPGAAVSGWLPPATGLERVVTARLLPTRYSDSVLTRVASSEEDLAAIYALDNATNERLLAEAGGRLSIRAGELVHAGPYARIVNAAFTHPHPLGARFSSSSRGAWYSGFDLATAKAEVLFHRAVQLEEVHWDRPEVVDYDHYAAEFAGLFFDLRLEQNEPTAEAARRACLDPGSYVVSQTLAVHLGELGAQGVVYPSARRPGGTCLACFQPRGVHSVRKRELHRLTWYPGSPATFRRVPRG